MGLPRGSQERPFPNKEKSQHPRRGGGASRSRGAAVAQQKPPPGGMDRPPAGPCPGPVCLVPTTLAWCRPGAYKKKRQRAITSKTAAAMALCVGRADYAHLQKNGAHQSAHHQDL